MPLYYYLYGYIYVRKYIKFLNFVMKYIRILELSDSRNLAITIVEVVVFTIMNTIMIEDLLNISIHS